jgi:hypothetical protein
MSKYSGTFPLQLQTIPLAAFLEAALRPPAAFGVTTKAGNNSETLQVPLNGAGRGIVTAGRDACVRSLLLQQKLWKQPL